MSVRGIRNNNPGNIDFNKANNWQGQLGIEIDLPKGIKARFARFDTPENGIRAMCKLLQNYARKYGADTIREVVHRYAPPHENKTDKYTENVSKWSGLDPDAKFNARDLATMQKLVPAIIRQECGVQPYSTETITAGIELALR